MSSVVERMVGDLMEACDVRKKSRRKLCAFIRRNIELSEDIRLKRKSGGGFLGDYSDSQLVGHVMCLLKKGGK